MAANVLKVKNEGSREKSVTVYKTTRCHFGDGHNINVIFYAVRTPYLTFNFVRRFAARHIKLNHKRTTQTSNNLNCYSALARVSKRTDSSHCSDIPKTEYINVRH
jgi:hypothetical protein